MTGAAAAALGVIAAETLVGAGPAQATQGQPVILGQPNDGATQFTELSTTPQVSAMPQRAPGFPSPQFAVFFRTRT